MTPGRIAILLCLAALLGAPFALRPSRPAAPADAERLIIITPHREMIRNEYGAAFDRWHERTHGRRANVIWSNPGGTSEIRKMLIAQYRAALEGGTAPGGNADLVFGGGQYEHDKLKAGVTIRVDGVDRHRSITVPVDFDDAWLDATYGPNRIGSSELYDPQRSWFGTALSGFGIVYNRDVLASIGVPEPLVWSDLCDPRLQRWVAVGNPAQSGSILKSFDTVLQRYGWVEGWQVLRRIGANARYFSAASSRVPIDVSRGEAAAGICIDFYGRFESQAIAEGEPDRSGPPRVGYVDPVGLSAIDADPISMLQNAPNPVVARRFIEFCLSEEGQALWQFHVRAGEGAAGEATSDPQTWGPRWRELRRMPIRRSMYAGHIDRFVDRVDPYALAEPFDEFNRSYWGLVTPLFAAMAMESHHELRAAWVAITAHPAYPVDPGRIVTAADVGDPQLRAMLECFDAMPAVAAPSGASISLTGDGDLAAVVEGWLDGGWSPAGLWEPEADPVDVLRRRFGRFFTDRYEQVLRIADGEASDP